MDVDVEERKREGSRFLDGRRKRKEEEKKIPGTRPASQSKKPKRAQGISTLTRSVLSDPPPPPICFSFFLFGPFLFLLIKNVFSYPLFCFAPLTEKFGHIGVREGTRTGVFSMVLTLFCVIL